VTASTLEHWQARSPSVQPTLALAFEIQVVAQLGTAATALEQSGAVPAVHDPVPEGEVLCEEVGLEPLPSPPEPPVEVGQVPPVDPEFTQVHTAFVADCTAAS